MRIPVYIDGKEEGFLIIERKGAFTVASAKLRDVGRVVRLRVYGDGEAYLGVPTPCGDGLCLVRRFSPREMLRFPAHPTYAAEQKREPEAAPEASEDREGRHVLWLGGRAHYF